MDKDNKNTELDNTDKKLHISDVKCCTHENNSLDEDIIEICVKCGNVYWTGI